MAKVEEKQPVVKEISAKIDGAASAVIVDARGLTVTEDTALRKALREAGVEYKVYKNTMMKIAFNGTDFAQLDPYLNGPSALAVSKDDATAAARVIAKFQKTSDKLQMKGGVVEGTLYDEAGMAEIAKIPSREELLSKRGQEGRGRRCTGRSRCRSTCSRSCSCRRSKDRSVISSVPMMPALFRRFEILNGGN